MQKLRVYVSGFSACRFQGALKEGGSVSPCIYTNLPLKGAIPRFFCGSSSKIDRLCFGNLYHEDFLALWHCPASAAFRNALNTRFEEASAPYDCLAFNQVGTLETLAQAEKQSLAAMQRFPLPEVCRTCYKAYGV